MYRTCVVYMSSVGCDAVSRRLFALASVWLPVITIIRFCPGRAPPAARNMMDMEPSPWQYYTTYIQLTLYSGRELLLALDLLFVIMQLSSQVRTGVRFVDFYYRCLEYILVIWTQMFCAGFYFVFVAVNVLFYQISLAANVPQLVLIQN